MILIKVSSINSLWLRRLALVISLPLMLLVMSAHAAFLAVVTIAMEPFRRILEVCVNTAEAWPSFKRQWKAK